MKETEAQRDARTDPRYAHVREAFAKLDTQDKAAFVLEATFDTVGQALHDVGQAVGDAVEKMGKEDFFDDLFRRRASGPETGAPSPGPAEPPTGSARTTGSRKSGTTPPPGTSGEGGTPPVV